MILDKFNSVFKKIERGLTEISWIVCLSILFLIVIDVFLRFFFNRPLPATWEINEISMPIIVFLPFAFTATINGHVRVSLFRDRMSPRIKRLFDMISNLLCFAICSLLTYYSWVRFVESFRMNEEMLAAIRVPWWPGKMAMPIGMFMFTIRYLMQFFFNLKLKK